MAADPVVVDTSVWIDYFRGRDVPALVRGIDELLDTRAARVPRVVYAELCQGARSKRERDELQRFFRAGLIAEATDLLWEAAGSIAFDLRRIGRTVPLIDCYVAALGLERDWPLWSLDRHFRDIALVRPLVLYDP